MTYQVDYQYDAWGSRVQSSVDADGSGGGSAVTERYAYDGDNQWADLNGSNVVQVHYLYGEKVDEMLARSSGGSTGWYLTDRLGTVRVVANLGGAALDRITYDGFGQVTSESMPTFGDRFKWTGREFNSDTGLQYNRARYYLNETGRWLSEDPVRWAAGDANLYRYVGNATQQMTDPSGLDGLDPGSGGSGGPSSGGGSGSGLNWNWAVLWTGGLWGGTPGTRGYRGGRDNNFDIGFGDYIPGDGGSNQDKELHGTRGGRRGGGGSFDIGFGDYIPPDGGSDQEKELHGTRGGRRGGGGGFDIGFGDYIPPGGGSDQDKELHGARGGRRGGGGFDIGFGDDIPGDGGSDQEKELYGTRGGRRGGGGGFDIGFGDDIPPDEDTEQEKELYGDRSKRQKDREPGNDAPRLMGGSSQGNDTRESLVPSLTSSSGVSSLGAANTPLDVSPEQWKKFQQDVNQVNERHAKRAKEVLGLGYYYYGSHDIFHNISDGMAAIGDTVSINGSKRVRQFFGYDDTVRYGGTAYRVGGYVGTVLDVALSVVNPCSLMKQGYRLASYGLRTLNLAQGIGNGLNAQEALASGDIVGAMTSMQGMRGNIGNAIRPCFTGKMLIATTDGYKRFVELKKDDLVLASPEDGESKEIAPQLVEEVFERLGRIWLLKMGNEVIETTDEHPFWVEGQGWLPTCKLVPGDLLRTLDKRLVAVSSVEETERVETVYNCRVANWHTYYVNSEEGFEGVWSHNACSSTSGNNAASVIGRAKHNNFSKTMVKKGNIGKFRLKNGKEVDGLKYNKNGQGGIVYELKPNNPKARARGEKQLNGPNGYVQQVQKELGGIWRGIVIVY